MIQLAAHVVDVVVDRYGASPQLLAQVRLEEASGALVQAIALRSQVMIEPQRRQYDEDEVAGMADLFGGRSRWRDTLRPFLWTHLATVTRGFRGSMDVELAIPCSYDLEVAAPKYLHALRDGDLPLRFLFSGTVFTAGTTGFQVEQISWDLEAEHRMPVKRWRDAMDVFFPNSGWLRLDRETIDALMRFKVSRGLTTWEQVAGALLDAAAEPAR